MIEVVRAGPLTTVQDLGRPGYAHIGVPRSGALDVPALRRANALVGNPASAAALETTLGGCAVRLLRDAVVAVTGATARIRLDRVDAGPVVEAAAGSVLDVGTAIRGLRSYLAFSGGIAVEPVLGSRCTDVLSGLGPAVLRSGDRLPLGAPTGPPGHGADQADPGPLRVRLGPRDDWFSDATALLTTTWTVNPHSNRIGVRLDGPPLTRAITGELPSEGVVLGAVQVPADGRPLIFLADHPTTGGYPVIAVVDDVTPLAQVRPGTTVTFCGPER